MIKPLYTSFSETQFSDIGIRKNPFYPYSSFQVYEHMKDLIDKLGRKQHHHNRLSICNFVIGLPGSGKSTLMENYPNFVQLDPDDLRLFYPYIFYKAQKGENLELEDFKYFSTKIIFAAALSYTIVNGYDISLNLTCEEIDECISVIKSTLYEKLNTRYFVNISVLFSTPQIVYQATKKRSRTIYEKYAKKVQESYVKNISKIINLWNEDTKTYLNIHIFDNRTYGMRQIYNANSKFISLTDLDIFEYLSLNVEYRNLGCKIDDKFQFKIFDSKMQYILDKKESFYETLSKKIVNYLLQYFTSNFQYSKCEILIPTILNTDLLNITPNDYRYRRFIWCLILLRFLAIYEHYDGQMKIPNDPVILSKLPILDKHLVQLIANGNLHSLKQKSVEDLEKYYRSYAIWYSNEYHKLTEGKPFKYTHYYSRNEIHYTFLIFFRSLWVFNISKLFITIKKNNTLQKTLLASSAFKDQSCLFKNLTEGDERLSHSYDFFLTTPYWTMTLNDIYTVLIGTINSSTLSLESFTEVYEFPIRIVVNDELLYAPPRGELNKDSNYIKPILDYGDPETLGANDIIKGSEEHIELATAYALINNIKGFTRLVNKSKKDVVISTILKNVHINELLNAARSTILSKELCILAALGFDLFYVTPPKNTKPNDKTDFENAYFARHKDAKLKTYAKKKKTRRMFNKKITKTVFVKDGFTVDKVGYAHNGYATLRAPIMLGEKV